MQRRCCNLRVDIVAYFNSEKDKELLDWLNSKNGKSSFIRFTLYEKMREEKNNMTKVAPQPQKEEISKDVHNDNFNQGFAKFVNSVRKVG